VAVEHRVHQPGARVWQHLDVQPDANQLIAAQRDAAINWLAGPDARKRARSLLTTLGPVAADLVDDVIQEAVRAVLVRFGRLDAPLPEDGPDAMVKYATTVLKSKAADVMRGTIRVRRREEPLGHRDDSVADLERAGLPARPQVRRGLEGQDPVPGDTDEGRLIDLARMAVLATPTAGDAVRSAALTYLAVDEVPTVPSGWRVPLPKAGANATQRKTWPGLWLAGQHSLFDPDDSVARRKARSRAAGKVMDLLHEVLAELAAQGLVFGGSAQGAR